MITRKYSDQVFWSLVLEYSRNIFGIYRFVNDGICDHFPVLSKDQFNIVNRVSKNAHDLGQLACSMLAKLNEDEG